MLAGAAIAVLGLVLADVPLDAQSLGPTFVPSVTAGYIIDYAAPLDLLFPRVEYTLAWTATGDQTNVSVVDCGADALCAHPDPVPVAVGHGLYGDLAFAGRANTYYEILPTGGGVTVTVRYTTPLIGGAAGFGAVLGGVVLFSLGLTGPRRRGAPPPEEEETEEEAPLGGSAGSTDAAAPPASGADRLRRRQTATAAQA